MSEEKNLMDIAFDKASEEMASQVPERELEFEDIFDMRAYAKTKAGFELSEDSFTCDHRAWQIMYLFWDKKLEKILGPQKKARLDELIGHDDGVPVVSADLRTRLGI